MQVGTLSRRLQSLARRVTHRSARLLSAGAGRREPDGLAFGPDGCYRLRVAGDLRSRREAFRLVYGLYREKGYIDPHPSGMAVSLFQALPEAVTIVIEGEGRTLAAVTVVPDSPLGLPTDNLYKAELDALRARGRRLAGVVALGAAMEVQEAPVLAKLFNAVFLVAHRIMGCTDFEIIVKPRHARFYRKLLGFEPLGPERSDPRANGAVGCLERCDLVRNIPLLEASRRGGDAPKLYAQFERGEGERELLRVLREGARPMSARELRYFFMEQTETFARADRGKLEKIAERYPSGVFPEEALAAAAKLPRAADDDDGRGADMWLWNSLPTRCRSISDVFLDNGVAILQTHLAGLGRRVHCEDWADFDFFDSLSPRPLTGALRGIYLRMVEAGPARRRALGALSLALQAVLGRIQRRRMERRIEDLARRFVAGGSRVFGIKVWYGEAYRWARRLAARILELDPECLVLAGGYHATLYEEDLLGRSPFDFAVVSEGEFVLGRILEVAAGHRGNWSKAAVVAELTAMADRGGLPNLVYRRAGAIVKTAREAHHLGAKTVPDYRNQGRKVPVHVLTEAVGCLWGKCSFCVHGKFNGHYRPRPVAEVVAEMREMARQGVGMFRLAESDLPAARGEELARAILEAGLAVEYVTGHRASNGARERFDALVGQYRIMIRSGLRAVFIGAETGNDWVNEHVMNKGVRREDLVWTMRALRRARDEEGLPCDIVLSMIHPVPTLGRVPLDEVVGDNLRLIREGRPDVVQPNPPAPIKGADWHERAAEYGFELNADFIPVLMDYEYCLCKPTDMWTPLDLSLEGRGFHAVMAECDRFRRLAEAEGIATNLSDENCHMMRIAGYSGREGAMRFRLENFLALASCDYRVFRQVEIGRASCRERV